MLLHISGVARNWKPSKSLLPSSPVRLQFSSSWPSSALTAISADGIFAVIESCKKLQNLDLTSCRQIPIPDRRRIFEGRRHITIHLSILTSPIGMGGIPTMTQYLGKCRAHVLYMKCGVASSRMVYISMLIHITIIVTRMQTSNVRRIVAG